MTYQHERYEAGLSDERYADAEAWQYDCRYDPTYHELVAHYVATGCSQAEAEWLASSYIALTTRIV